MSYPSAGARRDELHLYGLGAEGAPAVTPSRRTFAIDESEAAALAPDGRHFVTSCGTGLCVRDWSGGSVKQRRLASISTVREKTNIVGPGRGNHAKPRRSDFPPNQGIGVG